MFPESSALLLAASLILLALAGRAFGQVATGLPSFGSFSGGSFDTVNNANLNVHFEIPVVNKAGRGLPFYYVLTYDSTVWSPQTVNGKTKWAPAGGWGWGSVTSDATGYVTYQSSQETCYTSGDPPRPHTYYDFYNFTYFDPSGTSHLFPIEISTVSSTTCNLHYPPSSLTKASADGSGYTITATAPGGTTAYGSVYSASGTKLIPPFLPAGQPPPASATSVEDSNGNEISSTVSGNSVYYIDTLGQQQPNNALTVSGTPPGSVSLVYLDSSGSAQVKVNYKQQTVSTDFVCSGVTDTEWTANLVNGVDLPNGTSYSFTYDPVGRLTSVTLPAGGTITYAYSGGNEGITCADGSAATLTRTTPDGTWTYAHTESSPTTWATTITDPQGNQTVYNFQGIYETERQIYQGSSTLLETVYTCYNGAAAPCNGTAVPSISSITETTDWASGHESKTVTDYAWFGLPTEIDQYGYGSGTTEPLISKTLISYDTSLGNNIEDRPKSIAVENGSGTTVAETTYGYDQTAVTGTSGTPQHISVSGSRGNLTTLTEYVTGSSTLSRTFTYFDTGEVESATDFAGHATSFTYGDCGNSFPTQVSQPLSLTSSMSWGCSTGLVNSVTDPNNQTTTFSYDELYRLSHIANPDGGSTSIDYSGANEQDIYTARTSSASRHDQILLDSLARVSQQSLQSDPEGTDYVNTTYDSLGRVASVTNPFRSGSSTGGDTYS